MSTDIFAGNTHLCQAWALTRSDGEVLGFTDHDQDLEFENIRFRASSGLTAVALQQTTGLSVDNTEAVGALSADVVREADIIAGRYDGAQVRAWLVCWDDVSLRQLQFSGTIGGIARSGPSFKAELRGLTEALNTSAGRIFHRLCAHSFGDQGCAKTVADFQTDAVFTGDATGAMRIGLAEDKPLGWFTRGVAEMTSGAAKGLRAPIKQDLTVDGARQIVLWTPFGVQPAIGDQMRLTAGCDKRIETCRAKFTNAARFGGFPHIPGEDWLMAVPRSDGTNDGGSRSA